MTRHTPSRHRHVCIAANNNRRDKVKTLSNMADQNFTLKGKQDKMKFIKLCFNDLLYTGSSWNIVTHSTLIHIHIWKTIELYKNQSLHIILCCVQRRGRNIQQRASINSREQTSPQLTALGTLVQPTSK